MNILCFATYNCKRKSFLNFIMSVVFPNSFTYSWLNILIAKMQLNSTSILFPLSAEKVVHINDQMAKEGLWLSECHSVLSAPPELCVQDHIVV